MINCTILKKLGDFNIIAKNPSIITKSFCSGTDAGLGEIESMTRIKEHPSYSEAPFKIYIFLLQMDLFVLKMISAMTLILIYML